MNDKIDELVDKLDLQDENEKLQEVIAEQKVELDKQKIKLDEVTKRNADQEKMLKELNDSYVGLAREYSITWNYLQKVLFDLHRVYNDRQLSNIINTENNQ